MYLRRCLLWLVSYSFKFVKKDNSSKFHIALIWRLSFLKEFPVLRPAWNDLYIQCVIGKNDIYRNRLAQIPLDKKTLTLYFAMSWNGQTHFRNLAAFAARFLKCAWPIYDIAKWRVLCLGWWKITNFVANSSGKIYLIGYFSEAVFQKKIKKETKTQRAKILYPANT